MIEIISDVWTFINTYGLHLYRFYPFIGAGEGERKKEKIGREEKVKSEIISLNNGIGLKNRQRREKKK